MDPRADPEPHPLGKLRFPIAGTPDDVAAELVVGQSRNPDHGSVLSIEISPHEPEEAHFLAGAMRAWSSAEVKTWTSPEGELLDMVIMTEVQPDYRASRDDGIVLEQA